MLDRLDSAARGLETRKLCRVLLAGDNGVLWCPRTKDLKAKVGKEMSVHPLLKLNPQLQRHKVSQQP